MAITAPLMWLDGEIVGVRETALPLMGHPAQRGSLVFDVDAFGRTARGPALFRAREHVARFRRSAKIVGLDLPFGDEELVAAAARVVRESGSEEGLVRWSIFLAAGEPDLVPRDRATHVAVAAQSLQDPPRLAPIAVAVFDDARKAAPEVLPPDTKAAGAYLGPMLARRRALDAGADDVVLLDRDGDIAEAPIANAFAVVDGALWTPPLGRVLPGVTRDTVLALAREAGVPVREERLPRDVFESADEAFLTATSLPLAPIGRVNARALPTSPGPVTSLLVDLILRARRGELPSREDWLTFVRDE